MPAEKAFHNMFFEALRFSVRRYYCVLERSDFLYRAQRAPQTAAESHRPQKISRSGLSVKHSNSKLYPSGPFKKKEHSPSTACGSPCG